MTKIDTFDDMISFTLHLLTHHFHIYSISTLTRVRGISHYNSHPSIHSHIERQLYSSGENIKRVWWWKWWENFPHEWRIYKLDNRDERALSRNFAKWNSLHYFIHHHHPLTHSLVHLWRGGEGNFVTKSSEWVSGRKMVVWSEKFGGALRAIF